MLRWIWIVFVAFTTQAPGYTGDLPDPTWLAIGTNTSSANVPLLVSSDLGSRKQAGDAMPGLAAWVKPGLTWAPSVLRRGNRWVLYYAARDRATDLQQIGRAVASSPRGPFVDASARPLISTPEEGGAIDASPFVDDDGRAYLLWKGDGNALGQQTHHSGGWWESDGYGPGGQELFDGPGGTWMAYHAWTAPRVGYTLGGARRLRVRPVSWNGGMPVVQR